MQLAPASRRGEGVTWNRLRRLNLHVAVSRVLVRNAAFSRSRKKPDGQRHDTRGAPSTTDIPICWRRAPGDAGASRASWPGPGSAVRVARCAGSEVCIVSLCGGPGWAGVGSRVGPKRQRRRPGRAAIRGRAGLVGDVRCRDPRLPLYPAVPTSRDTGHLRSPPALRLGTRNAERVRSGARHVASVCAADCACAPRHSGDTGLCTMARCPRARQRDTGTARDYFGRARTTECARMLALAVPQPKGPDARHFGSSTFSPRSYASRVARSESTS